MKALGTKKEVLCGKATKTKKGLTRENLCQMDVKLASRAKRSAGAQKSPWTAHVLAHAKKKGISFAAALADPSTKGSYKKPGSTPTPTPKTKEKKEKKEKKTKVKETENDS